MPREANDSPLSPSHLFTVRVWAEDLGDGQSEWRGQVQHVLSEETRYFREWDGLVDFLQVTLAQLPDKDEGIAEFEPPD